MAMRCSSFEVLTRDLGSHARTGVLTLPHGQVPTPAFMPVGTHAAVRTVAPTELEDAGADIILSNTLHLIGRPGTAPIKQVGGLHRFMAWNRPILVDSGGFQVFSMRDVCTLDDDGATFRNPWNGDRIRVTPESIVQAQIDLGVDVGMVLDHCPPLPAPADEIRLAMDRSMDWAERALSVPRDEVAGPALFGIVQGGLDLDLRAESIDRLVELPFDGYALGGLSVGEGRDEMLMVVGFAASRLPEGRSRYLMGVGYPEDIVEAVAAGVDMFDCVLPTRNARNGNLFTSEGRIIIKHAAWRTDERPLDEACGCPVCQRYSRAYLRHLFLTKDGLAARLLSVHNLHHWLDLMRRIRRSIADGTFGELLAWARSRDVDGLSPSARRAR
jgi:queuine tRNA-ribosyltransferase